MTEEQLNEWVAALRSGEYSQGRRALADWECNEFCCLGVFADLNDLFVDPPEDDVTDLGMVISDRGIRDTAHLSSKTIPMYLQEELINANDSDVPFTGIADYIEKNKEHFID